MVNCKAKAVALNNVFVTQCRSIANGSVLPFKYLTLSRLNSIHVTDGDIISIIKSLNPGKSNGPDEISSKMLLLCGDSVVLPLKITFKNILLNGIFPDSWKLANVVPIHNKDDKQLVKNYRPISLLPICAKVFEKLIFKHLCNYFHSNNVITEKPPGFRPFDSSTNQLNDFLHEIHQSFDDKTLFK